MNEEPGTVRHDGRIVGTDHRFISRGEVWIAARNVTTAEWYGWKRSAPEIPLPGPSGLVRVYR